MAGVWCWRQAQVPGPTDDAWTLAADAVLDAPVGDLSFAGGEDAAMRRLPVEYDPKPDAWGDGDGDTPIILHLRGATLRQALRALNFRAGRGRLAWWYDPDAGRIAVDDWSRQMPTTVKRFYDVGDLVTIGHDLANRFRRVPPQYGVEPWTRQGQEHELDRFLRGLVDDYGYTWDYSGSGGWPAFVHTGLKGGRLTVTQTPDRQRRIELLLAALGAKEFDETL